MRVELSRPVALSVVADALGTEVFGTDALIRSVVTDSREAGDGSLFFAIVGAREDGHRYIGQARQKGAAAAVVCQQALSDGLPTLRVRDTVRALGQLAGYYRSLFPCRCMMITGSMGKTSAASFAASLLRHGGRSVCATTGNRNNAIGLPMTMLSVREEDEFLLLEAGMNHAGEISALSRIARPDVAIICSIGSAHIGEMGGIDAIRDAKYEIVDGMRGGTLLVPHEETGLRNRSYPSMRTFSLGEEAADYALAKDETSDRWSVKAPGEERLEVAVEEESKLFRLSFLRAFSLCHAAGADARELVAGIKTCRLPPQRQQLIEKNGVLLLDDAYNASPESVELSLERLCEMKVKGRKYVLLGDMLELGEYSESIHRRIGGIAAKTDPERLFLTGRYAPFVARGACESGYRENRICILTHEEVFDTFPYLMNEMLADGDVLLIKGAHTGGLFRLGDILGFGRRGQ